MKTKAEVIELLGMTAVAEVKDDAGEVISPAYDPSAGFNFAGFALSSVKGSPIEFAGTKCNADCFANMDADTLYVATKGSISGGTALK